MREKLKKSFIVEIYGIFFCGKKMFLLVKYFFFSSMVFDLDVCCFFQKVMVQVYGRVYQIRSVLAIGVSFGVFFQVFILLWIVDWMVYYFWRKGKDSDSFFIFYFIVLGDLLGIVLLVLSFYFFWFIGDRDGDVGD